MSDKERGDIATRFKVGNEFLESKKFARKKADSSQTPKYCGKHACLEYFQWCSTTTHCMTARACEIPRHRQSFSAGTARCVPYDRLMGLCNYLWILIIRLGTNYKEKPDFFANH